MGRGFGGLGAGAAPGVDAGSKQRHLPWVHGPAGADSSRDAPGVGAQHGRDVMNQHAGLAQGSCRFGLDLRQVCAAHDNTVENHPGFGVSECSQGFAPFVATGGFGRSCALAPCGAARLQSAASLWADGSYPSAHAHKPVRFSAPDKGVRNSAPQFPYVSDMNAFCACQAEFSPGIRRVGSAPECPPEYYSTQVFRAASARVIQVAGRLACFAGAPLGIGALTSPAGRLATAHGKGLPGLSHTNRTEEGGAVLRRLNTSRAASRVRGGVCNGKARQAGVGRPDSPSTLARVVLPPCGRTVRGPARRATPGTFVGTKSRAARACAAFPVGKLPGVRLCPRPFLKGAA